MPVDIDHNWVGFPSKQCVRVGLSISLTASLTTSDKKLSIDFWEDLFSDVNVRHFSLS